MSKVLGMARSDYDSVVLTEDAGHTARGVTNAPAPSFTEWNHASTEQIKRGRQA